MPAIRKLLPLATLLLAAAPARPAEAPPSAGLPTVAQIFAKDAWGRLPSQLAWSPDGRRLAYLWRDGEGTALWTLDGAGGRAEPVLRDAELAWARDGKAGGEAPAFDAFRWAPGGDALVVLAGGDLYLFRLAGRSLRRLTATAADEEDPKLSPKGDRVAFVRGEDLYAVDLATGREVRLTTGGEANVTLQGKTDWVYWEELWNRASTGFWWSPDGRRIAYYRFDERPVGVYPIVDDVPKYPTVRWQKYPKAGEPNPRVRVGVLELASGRTAWMATGGGPEGDADAYLPRVAWSPDGGRLAVERLDRDQTRLDLLSCDPRSGQCATLWSERDETWVNVGDDFAMLEDGRFVWGSERDGWRRLYLHGADGKPLRALSPPGWCVTSLDAAEPDGTLVYTAYETAELGAAGRQVLRSRLDRDAFERLTNGRGTYAALVAPGTGSWVETWTDADTPPRQRLLAADGRELAALPTAPATAADPAALPKWELFTIPGPEGSRLPARLLKPAGFDPARRYPVLIYHYGGPASQVVVDRWGSRDAWHKWMALRGYAVFGVDNQASLFFGKKGEDRLHRRFGELELAGQLAGVEYLKTLPWIDPARLGLWGWSGGGSNTLYSLFHRPGVWKAGVAGAPVVDWSLYDSIWTERYLDRPQENPEGYQSSSPITAAGDLKDELLVVHGTGDDNVHPQNTLHLIRRLTEAGLPFEDAFLPGQTHAVQGDAQVHFYQRMTGFFDRTLGGGR